MALPQGPAGHRLPGVDAAGPKRQLADHGDAEQHLRLSHVLLLIIVVMTFMLLCLYCYCFVPFCYVCCIYLGPSKVDIGTLGVLRSLGRSGSFKGPGCFLSSDKPHFLVA